MALLDTHHTRRVSQKSGQCDVGGMGVDYRATPSRGSPAPQRGCDPVGALHMLAARRYVIT